jgi:hypothetical protein
MVWARFEALLWWQQGRDLPPLVTTDPATEPFATAGILPDATILFGNGTEEGDMSAGGRFDIGTWTDPSQCYGIGWRFFGVGSDGLGFRSTSVQNPVLAIPFGTINPTANDALVISYPGIREGEINFTANSEVLGNDIYGRFLLCRGGICRIDFITGYHFSRVNDAIAMRSQFTDVDPQSVDFGSVTTVVDQFAGSNEFHGGIVGFIWERDCGCWNTQLLARTALGGMRERMRIDGSFTFDTLAAPPVVTAGGLFTTPTTGTYNQTEFAAVTEIGATCAIASAAARSSRSATLSSSGAASSARATRSIRSSTWATIPPAPPSTSTPPATGCRASTSASNSSSRPTLPFRSLQIAAISGRDRRRVSCTRA